MLATAVKLAQERGASVEALHVIRVPLELPLDAELLEEEERAEASLAEAQAARRRARRQGRGRTVRARSIGEAIVQEATGADADLIVLGSAPALAPAVAVLLADRRLRPPKAPCEVLVVAFPQGRVGGTARHNEVDGRATLSP